MHMPTPTGFVLPPRSRGLLEQRLNSRGGYDPQHGGWIAIDRDDDLSPRDADPLSWAADRLDLRGLALRPWARGDLAAFRGLLDDPAVWAHLPEPYPDPLTDSAAADLIDLANRLDSHLVRAVTCETLPVGQVRLDLAPLRAGRGFAELSYWLGRVHWGQGFGTALVAGTAARAFGRMPGLLRLVAKVRPENPPSARVLERAGFTPCPAPLPGFDDWRWFALRRQDARPARG